MPKNTYTYNIRSVVPISGKETSRSQYDEYSMRHSL